MRRLLALIWAWLETDPPRAPAGWIICPDCGEQIPIGLTQLAIVLDESGEQILTGGELEMDDVWAHAWTHEK